MHKESLSENKTGSKRTYANLQTIMGDRGENVNTRKHSEEYKINKNRNQTSNFMPNLTPQKHVKKQQ